MKIPQKIRILRVNYFVNFETILWLSSRRIIIAVNRHEWRIRWSIFRFGWNWRRLRRNLLNCIRINRIGDFRWRCSVLSNSRSWWTRLLRQRRSTCIEWFRWTYDWRWRLNEKNKWMNDEEWFLIFTSFALNPKQINKWIDSLGALNHFCASSNRAPNRLWLLT